MFKRMSGLAACAVLCTLWAPTRQLISINELSRVELFKSGLAEAFTTTKPTVFHLHGHIAFCYELHVVNTTGVPVALKRVQVLGADSTSVLLDETGKDLSAVIAHFTEGEPAAKDAGAIGVGEQIVLYAWVDMPAGSAAPFSIRHALTLRPERGKDLQMITRELTVQQGALQIESPLHGSNWLALNGPSNTSSHRRTFFPLGSTTEVPQRYAIDWVMLDKSGRTFSGDEKRNESYFCYGQKVHAVADGVVAEVKDGIPQNIPGARSRAVPITLETIGGNHLIVNLGNGVYAFYAHLQPGSIRVKLGDHVKTGEVLGLLGNSGNSTEPHLHFHLIDHNSALDGEGLPFLYGSYRLLVEGTADKAKLKLLAQPRTVKLEMPAENDIVQFAPEGK